MAKQPYIEPVAITTTDAAGREHHGSCRYDHRRKLLTVTHNKSGESEVAAYARGNEEVLARVMLHRWPRSTHGRSGRGGPAVCTPCTMDR